jgi:hypothetical protein
MVGSCVPLSLSPLCFVSYPLAENLPFLYQANFASRIDGAPPFLRGVRTRLLLIQRVISRLREILGPSLVTLDLGVHLWHPGHVFYWDVFLFQLNLSLGRNCAEFPFFYLTLRGSMC